MPLTSPGTIVRHIKDTYICSGLQKGALAYYNKKKPILALTGEMQQRVKNWGQGYKEPPNCFLSREDIIETLRNVILSRWPNLSKVQ